VNAPLSLRAPGDAVAAVEAAQALLGIAIIDPTRLREAAHVHPEHFHEPTHGRVWQALEDLNRRGAIADVATLADRFAADPGLAALGGGEYLFNLVDKSPAGQLARHFADLVVEGHVRRQVAATLGETQRDVLDPNGRPAVSVLAELRQTLERLERDVSTDDHGLIAADAAGDQLLTALDEEASNGRERGAMTGLRCFDRRLRGLRPGWLVTIGGRPSMGKSGLAREAAYGCARRNPDKQVLFFSLEMERREVTERALSAATYRAGDGIAYNMFGNGLKPYERDLLRRARLALPGNLHIDDRTGISVDDVRKRIWAAKRRAPVAAVFIDYLQLMARPPAQGRNEASVIGEMTTALKQLAREAETCVVILSQLSRQVESRDDKRPQLADLRESGSIEQDSNAVLFPYREAYYLERAEPKDAASPEHAKWRQNVELLRRRMDVIAAKVRGGAIGTDRQVYFAEYDLVEDVAE
jgi:replicative DNA helicase